MRNLLPYSLSVILLSALLYQPVAFSQAADLPAAEQDSDEEPVLEDEPQDQGSEINIRNADIAAVIRIFSKRTKRNFILDERVKGKVSLYLPGRVSDQDSLRILDSVLALKGFTAVPVGENLWKVIPLKEAIQTTIPTVSDQTGDSSPSSSSMVTRLFQLQHIGSEEAKEILTPLVSSDGLLNAYTGTNSLIIIDSEDNIQRLIGIIESLDIPSSDSEMSIIPVEHADAADIAEKLNQILGTESEDPSDISGSSSLQARIQARVTAARIAAARARANSNDATSSEPLDTASGTLIQQKSKAPKIIPDERTNSIIVVADESMTNRIRALVSQLDSEVDRSGFRFYVYQCKHADAEELANVLGGLSGEGGTSQRSSTRSSSGLGDNNSPFGNRETSSNTTRNRLSNQSRSLGQSRLSSLSGNNDPVAVSLGENLSITSDPATNSLVIFSSKAEYEKLLELLKKIDVKQRQVLVEAVLLEVSIDYRENIGTDFLASAGGADGGVFTQSSFTGNLAQLISNPTQLAGFTAAAASSGSLTLPGGITIPSQAVLVSAAANNSDVNVLSAPNILATDNEPAEIVVGQNVPFLASTATSGDNLNNVFNTVDRQDVGITLRITPQISSTDTVRLNIFTEVSNVVQSTADSTLGPTTTVRTSETTVISKNHQMIVIGGLMSDGRTEVDTGVPILKDIPLLGHMFRATNSRTEKTNLLIFITPRILSDQFDARETTMNQRDALKAELNEIDVHPNRDEVLFNSDIDRVSNATMYDQELPSTMTPPSSPAATPSLPMPQTMESEVLEFRIAPKAPTVKSPSRSKGESFIILKHLGENNQRPALPFSIDKESGLAGIRLPREVAPFAKNFFQIGSSYQYKIEDRPLSFQVLGVFDVEEEARLAFPEITDSWYTPSAYEIMNLGVGPWTPKS